ncbi:MAG: Crp/Fnr family transcriptional regulator [Prolixibacteraceae bacterium]|jgi:CRP-like cAMP-binding protein|nr:Crp/Fnr family transcriptional regulator [Prolixibacteraceae bacterium]
MRVSLSTVSIFNGLDEIALNDILSQIIFQRKSFSEGALVVSQGEECNRLMILIEGKVKGEMSSPTGKSLKIEDMEAPSVLASAFLFGQNNTFPVNILAETEVKFIVIPKTELLKLFQISDRILQNFLSMISSRAQFLSEKLRFHSFKALKAKLSFYLMNESRQREMFKLRHSQNELSELFAVARPSVGRAFMQLQEDGIIDVRYKQVHILNRSSLALACNE